ncbi:FadR/GntR family transcriptional regulator [Bacillus sp. FJAT-29814]|uniref:FadR/GntR family transcriptional regulator n=1 Tax=Bacillus sp. FJAT-29814 TaxID=1729688 RepID=UPI00083595D1|nr:GntR family transcriptional regulator [Bacillus sp. FJAT-29814]
MIAADGLMQGDKIPSERELSERLNVGRSSVREALRALELLGLIETRRGEGTFIRDFHGHQLVQLLSTFILQDEKAKSDVYETKYLLEMDCLRLAVKKMDDAMINSMEKWLSETAQFHDDDFFCRIVQGAENHLFSRIWGILKDYYNALIGNPVQYDRRDYFLLVKALAEKNEQKTLSAYCKLRNLSID